MDPKFTDEPEERVTRICDAMWQAAQQHPEFGPDIRCIVLIDDEERGGIVLFGYDPEKDDTKVEAIANILQHLEAMFAAHGLQLKMAPIVGRG